MPLLPVALDDPHVPAHNEERDAINALEQAVSTKIPLPTGAMYGDLLWWDGDSWQSTETRFLEGNGPPDGVVAAPIGSRYIDKTGAQGAIEWVKRANGDTNTGWFCVAGDTGLRNIAGLIDNGNGTVHTAVVSRIGNTVDMYLDMTMPSNRGDTWPVFKALNGFGPGFVRYAAMQDNNERATSKGSQVNASGGITLYGVIGGRRDRFTGTWSTRDPWPKVLPGTSA